MNNDTRIQEKEHIISRDPESSHWYAFHVINGRWPEDSDREEKENVIGQDREYSLWYTCFILRRRWPAEGPDGLKKKIEKENVLRRWSFGWKYYLKLPEN